MRAAVEDNKRMKGNLRYGKKSIFLSLPFPEDCAF
jgi:hypothetical protein